MSAFRTLSGILLILSLSQVAEARSKSADAADAAGPAEAAATEAPTAEPAYEPLVFEPVGLASVDDFFAKAGDLTGTIDSASKHIASTRTGISAALGLAEDVSIKDGLADLQKKAKGKLKLSMDKGGFPKIDAGKGTPADVKSAMTGVNSAIGELPLAAADLVKVIPAAKGLVDEAKSLPQKLPKDAKAAGASLFKIPKMVMQTKKNITTLVKVPTVAQHLLDQVTSLVNEIKDAFAPAA